MDADQDPYQCALRHHRAGQWDDAIRVCREILALRPDDANALNMLGVALVQAGQLSAAIEVLTAAVKRLPGHIQLLANLAVSLHQGGEARMAAWRFRQLAVIQPWNALAFTRLGTLAQDQGDLDRACRLLDRAARLEPLDELTCRNLGFAQTSNGNLGAALAALRRAITLRPDNANAYAQAATVLMRQGELAAMATHLRRTSILDRNNAEAANLANRYQRYTTAIRGLSARNVGTVPATGLVMRSPFGTPSGYAHMGKRYIQTLRQQDVPLQVIGVFGHETWPEEPLNTAVPARAAVNVLIPLAVEPIPGLATVTCTMFEGTCIPASWARLSARSDLVVVPTESSRIAWASRGFPENRLRVCPLGVDPEPAAAQAPALILVDGRGRLVSSFRNRFLNISDAIPRKNLDGLLRVWLRCTSAKDDAVLILKAGKGGSSKARAMLGDVVRQTQQHVGRSISDAAPVVVIDQPLDEASMTGLFRAATHYWSLSHGEGWDLPMSKAGAMGLGLIAPRHSAYVDYLDDTVARMIPARTGPAHLPYSSAPWEPFFGLDWWEPDEDAAAEILTRIIQGRDARLPDARAHLLGRFTWGQATRKLRRILADAGILDAA